MSDEAKEKLVFDKSKTPAKKKAPVKKTAPAQEAPTQAIDWPAVEEKLAARLTGWTAEQHRVKPAFVVGVVRTVVTPEVIKSLLK